jgi:hypothetical protein
MFIGFIKDALGWFVSAAEAGLVITLVLLIGLFLGMTGFWIMGRLLGKLGGRPAADAFEEEPEEATDVDSPSEGDPGGVSRAGRALSGKQELW